MARLRSRIVKADYWGDGDLLRMPRDKRDTYRGLWAVAEDSGCLEDDPFTWKLLLWPGPLDADITVEKITVWRDQLVEDGKLVPYCEGKRRFFFIEPFHRHEHPRNPQINNLPLPAWVRWIPSATDARKGSYQVDWEVLAAYREAAEGLNNDSTSVVQALSPARPALPGPVLSGTDRSHARGGARPASESNGASGWVAAWVEAVIEAGLDEPSKSDKAIFGRKVKEIPDLDDQIMHDTIGRMVELGKPPGVAALVYGDVKRMGEEEIMRMHTEVRHVR